MTEGEARYRRNPDFVFRRIVDEMVLVPVHQRVADMDCIYTLNGVGAFLWERLEHPATEAELCRAVLEEYSAEPQAVLADLQGFLRGMLEIDAVRRS